MLNGADLAAASLLLELDEPVDGTDALPVVRPGVEDRLLQQIT